METSRLKPFLRPGLDVLFVGLNPAKGSSDNGHYFSVNRRFWNQLYASGLITTPVDRMTADELVFDSTAVNYAGWNYGITDLVSELAHSDSEGILPTDDHCRRLVETICALEPRAVVLMHSKVRDKLAHYLRVANCPACGQMGKWLAERKKIEFFVAPFPHGTGYKEADIVDIYKQVRHYLESSDD